MAQTFNRGEYEKRIAWWQHDRFGMFIHWGLYSVLARGEWAANIEGIPSDEYEKLFGLFDPQGYDPAAWVRLAREAGMKYVVLTAKHHEGFCLFDSKLTDFTSVNAPLGRDVVRDFVDAAHAEGLKVGLYYSLLDWHHPDYPHATDKTHPERGREGVSDEGRDFNRYLDYLHGQVRELCTSYGKLDLLWFDFSYGDLRGEAWRASELMDMVRTLQPGILVNNRLECSGKGLGSLAACDPTPYYGDFVTPEQVLPPHELLDAHGDKLAWEACVTMNDSWGYCATDDRFKSSSMLIHKLVECVSKGGNMILNVGPDGQGRIPVPSVKALHEIGDWMRRNGEGVYGCGSVGGGPVTDVPSEWGSGRVTRRDSAYYYHLFENSVGPMALPGMKPADIVRMCRVDDGSIVPLAQDRLLANYPDTAFACLGPSFVAGAAGGAAELPDTVDTVVKVETAEAANLS